MEEEFKDIPGYEGLYQINRKGEVKSLERYVKHSRGGEKLLKEKILKHGTKKSGYKYVILHYDNKISKNIHQLVYLTFVIEYDTKKLQIDHIDRNRSNNSLSNLRLVSCRTNHNNRTNQSSYECGVYKRGNIYHCLIQINKKLIHLGYFETSEQAHKKYLEVKKQIEEIEKITHNYTYNRTKIGKEYFIELFKNIEPS